MTTLQLKQEFVDYINELDIAPFIANEALALLKHTNKYKLANLREKQDEFGKYLCSLDKENTKQIKAAICLKDDVDPTYKSQKDYWFKSYLSCHGESVVGTRRITRLKFYPVLYEITLLQLINNIKALFLFGCTEFTHTAGLRLQSQAFLLPNVRSIRKRKNKKKN